MQAWVALDSFKMLQVALLLSAGCVESMAGEVGIETAFFGWVDLLVTSYWHGGCCVRVCLQVFIFRQYVLISDLQISLRFHVVTNDKNISIFLFFSIKDLLSSSNRISAFLDTR